MAAVAGRPLPRAPARYDRRDDRAHRPGDWAPGCLPVRRLRRRPGFPGRRARSPASLLRGEPGGVPRAGPSGRLLPVARLLGVPDLHRLGAARGGAAEGGADPDASRGAIRAPGDRAVCRGGRPANGSSAGSANSPSARATDGVDSAATLGTEHGRSPRARPARARARAGRRSRRTFLARGDARARRAGGQPGPRRLVGLGARQPGCLAKAGRRRARPAPAGRGIPAPGGRHGLRLARAGCPRVPGRSCVPTQPVGADAFTAGRARCAAGRVAPRPVAASSGGLRAGRAGAAARAGAGPGA